MTNRTKTTSIDSLLDELHLDQPVLLVTTDNMCSILNDFSLPISARMTAFNLFFKHVGEDIIEVMRRLVSLYIISKAKLLEEYLRFICLESEAPINLRLQTAVDLCTHSGPLCFDVLEKLLASLKVDDVPSQIEVKAIFLLMSSEIQLHQDNALTFIKKILDDDYLDCEYRYKIILSVKTEFERKMEWAENETQKKFFNKVYLTMEKNMLFHFLSNDKNKTMYRILSGQILLSKFKVVEAEEIILKIALDETGEYNSRADATDVLLKYTLSDATKTKAKEIILELARIKGEVRSIYDNAQNAHSEAIENSATECLVNLSQEPLATYPNSSTPIDYEFVEKQIKFSATMGWNVEKIETSLNRIALDNALYSSLHISLKSALVLVYSFIFRQEHEDRFNLSTRLLQELEDSAGICSTGILERIVNSLSGYDEKFGLKISYEDQIKGNLSGRLNAKIMALMNTECLHKMNRKFCDCLSYACLFQKFLLNDKFVKTKFALSPCTSCVLCKKAECLHVCDDSCTFNEDFMNDVLVQMQLPNSDYQKRGKFLLFFRTYVGDIMQDMKEDFVETNILDVTTFDLYFRKAVLSYEGEV